MKTIEEIIEDFEKAHENEVDQVVEFMDGRNFEISGDWSDRSEDKK